MALAIHVGGPADGAEIPGIEQTAVRYYLPTAERMRPGWLSLARYVWVPPREGKRCRYQYTGTEQVQGPSVGSKEAPDWST